jgi:hypothetical protein
MDRNWEVEIGGNKHKVGLDYPVDLSGDDHGNVTPARDGKLVVDGNEVHTWKTLAEFPKEIDFDIEGKYAVLRKKGFFSTRLELFLDGKLMKSV